MENAMVNNDPLSAAVEKWESHNYIMSPEECRALVQSRVWSLQGFWCEVYDWGINYLSLHEKCKIKLTQFPFHSPRL